MAVNTKKFSEFADGGDLTENNTTVGVDGGVNTRFNNPWPFLPPGTTAERPTPAADMYFRLRFNTTSEEYEYYSPTALDWISIEDAVNILPLLASHAAGEGASLVGLEDQGTVISKTVQDLAEASFIAQTTNGTLVNAQFLDALASGFVTVTTGTGVLNSRQLVNTANQIDITNLDGSGNPVFSISSTLDLPGTLNIQSTTAVDSILDEDDMSSDSDTALATQQSIKAYVDSRTDNFNYLAPARVASVSNFTSTYNNGTAGVGATLTATSNGAASIDGVSLVLNDRVLFKDQSTTYENGVYFVSQVGDGSNPAIYTRTTDFDQPNEIQPGDIIAVLEGTVNANTGWLQTEDVNTVGTDAILFIQFIADFSNVVTLDGTQTITGDKTFTGTTIFDNLQISGNSISSNSGAVTIDPISGQPFTVNVIGGAGIDFNFTGAGDFDLNLDTGTFNINSTTGIDEILDEDNMASDSATALATQQSIKAYVDAQVGSSGGYQSAQIFTSGGTWTKPAGINLVRVIVVGGGGGGGGTTAGANTSCSGGGGGGGTAIETIDVTGTSSETVTIGAGGAGGASGGSTGSTGGTSSFGAFCSATGGLGGDGMGSVMSDTAPGGVGGSGSGGDVNIDGGVGGVGIVRGGNQTALAGGGGSFVSPSDGFASADATGYGVGGSGRSGGGLAGRAGSDGICIVYEYT